MAQPGGWVQVVVRGPNIVELAVVAIARYNNTFLFFSFLASVSRSKSPRTEKEKSVTAWKSIAKSHLGIETKEGRRKKGSVQIVLGGVERRLWLPARRGSHS